MFPALISAVGNAGELILDKITLSKRGVPLRLFLPIAFVFLFVLTVIFTPFFGFINYQTALLPNNLFLALLMIVTAVAWNVLIYQNIRDESVHRHEVMMMTAPLVTVLMAAVFFQEEFNLSIFILSLIASVALIFARTERHHFKIDKNSANLFLAVILMSVESIIIRELLRSYSPVSLYAIRTFFIGLFFLLYYQPKWKDVARSPLWLIGLSSAVGVTQMVAKFYAFDSLGVVFTTLVSTLGPIIVFLGSWEILHERIRPRVVIAAVVILACVTVATVIAGSS